MSPETQNVESSYSVGSRCGLAAAWFAFQLVRLVFLPFTIVGAGLIFASRRSEQAKAAKSNFYAKPYSSSRTDI